MAAEDPVGKFTIEPKPVNRAPFRNLEGWKFDEHHWADLDNSNKNIKLPLSTDLDLSGIPATFFQSGSNGGLEFVDITPGNERLFLEWNPGVSRGYYSVFNRPSFLHSSECITLVLRDDMDPDSIVYDDGALVEEVLRSQIEITRRPDPTAPILASYLKRDPTTLGIDFENQFSQVAVFTGLSSAGIELDGDQLFQANTELDEFKVVHDSYELVENLPLLVNVNIVLGEKTAIITLDEAPVIGFRPIFSNPNVFRTELTVETWMQQSGEGLTDGDYAIGYKGTAGEGCVYLYHGDDLPIDFGTISYRPNTFGRIVFNKNVAVQFTEVELTLKAESENKQIYYLPTFPVYELSSTTNQLSIGQVVFDLDCITLNIDGEDWTRVPSILAVGEEHDQNVFELDPFSGEITFGNEGFTFQEETVWGNRPQGDVLATWKAVPLIKYDPWFSSKIHSDKTEDLDPLTNVLKSGFLVLDSQKQVPWKIELTTSNPMSLYDDGREVHGRLRANAFGGLEIPQANEEDIGFLIAKVTDKNGDGVPNVPVHFAFLPPEAAPYPGYFSQEDSVTDSDGHAFTELYGTPIFNNFVSKIRFYNALDEDVEPYLNPAPSSLAFSYSPLEPIIGDSGVVGGETWGDENEEWEKNVLIIDGHVEGDIDSIYLFIVSIPGEETLDDYEGAPQPPEDCMGTYNAVTRAGGLSKVWSYIDEGAHLIVHPISIDTTNAAHTVLTFNRRLPLPLVSLEAGAARNLIMGYDIVIDRTVRVQASTTEPILSSNELEFLLTLNSSMTGQWKLPTIIGERSDGFRDITPNEEDITSSRISTGTYLSPNDWEVTDLQDPITEDSLTEISPGSDLWIIGSNFPVTQELFPSIFIIKITNGRITAVKDITANASIVSSDTILIEDLPTPPTGIEGEYFITVGGMLPSDVLSPFVSRTSKAIQIEG